MPPTPFSDPLPTPADPRAYGQTRRVGRRDVPTGTLPRNWLALRLHQDDARRLCTALAYCADRAATAATRRRLVALSAMIAEQAAARAEYDDLGRAANAASARRSRRRAADEATAARLMITRRAEARMAELRDRLVAR